MDIPVFCPQTPLLPKCTGNRFPFARSTQPYAGLPIVPLGSKVMADGCVSHYTSPCFLCVRTYCMAFCTVSSRTKMMFSSLPPPEQVIPIIGIVATSMWCAPLQLSEHSTFVKAGTWLWCFVASPKNRTRYANIFFVLRDGSDGCWVRSTSREHAVGACGDFLDGVIVQIFDVYTPDCWNLYCHVLYHRNYGYALAEKE